MKCNPWRWLWGLIPLLMVSWIAILSEQGRIESELTQKSQEALSRAGLPWAKIAFQGRDGVLTGTATEEVEPDKAANLVRDLRGVRVVDAKAGLVEKVDTFTWQAALRDNKVRLSGHVPNEETRKTILGVAKANFPNRDIDDKMTIARGAPPRDTWLGGVNFGLKQLAGLKRGVVDIEATNMSVSGEAEDANTYKTVKNALASGLPQGLRLKLDKVTPPVVNPYLWSAKWSGKQLLLAGFVPSDAQRQALVAAARKAFPDASVEDRMQLGDGAPEGWAAATASAVAELARLDEGGADLRANQLTVAGMAPDEGRAEIARRALRSSLPSTIKFTDHIKYREPPKPDPAELEARRRAEEEAKRKADADAAAKRAAEADARSKAEADAAAKRAAAEAEAKRKAEADAAAKRVAAEADTKRKAELQKCQDALNLAKAGVIRFQRASAEIDAQSFPTLDQVARAALTCPTAHIDIEGHTDAEGTPERNQALSVRRAQSIVSYLTRAGVDASKLTAVGYGESKPIAPNDTAENRAKNRRIEFSVKAN